MATRSLMQPLSFPSLFEDYFRPLNELMETSRLWNKVVTVPAVNINENDTSYKISLAAPGLTKEDFSIDVEEGTLTISAEKEERKEEKMDRTTREEFNYTSFTRSFSLPENIRQEAIDARYENGVLTITLPKKEEAKQTAAAKHIAVQ